MEPLLTTRVSRQELLLGKAFALWLVALAAGYGTLGVDPLYASNWNYFIPLANPTLAVKATLLGSLEGFGALMTTASGLTYVLAKLALGAGQLRREKIVARI